jgi:hypothetical protein
MTQSSALQPPAFRLAPDVEIDKESRWGFVVADQIPHQDVEHILVEFRHEGQYTRTKLALTRTHSTGGYFELNTNWLPSKSLKTADVPQGSVVGGFTNSTPREE